jgi:hypothetical protein
MKILWLGALNGFLSQLCKANEDGVQNALDGLRLFGPLHIHHSLRSGVQGASRRLQEGEAWEGLVEAEGLMILRDNTGTERDATYSMTAEAHPELSILPWSEDEDNAVVAVGHASDMPVRILNKNCRVSPAGWRLSLEVEGCDQAMKMWNTSNTSTGRFPMIMQPSVDLSGHYVDEELFYCTDAHRKSGLLLHHSVVAAELEEPEVPKSGDICWITLSLSPENPKSLFQTMKVDVDISPPKPVDHTRRLLIDGIDICAVMSKFLRAQRPSGKCLKWVMEGNLASWGWNYNADTDRAEEPTINIWGAQSTRRRRSQNSPKEHSGGALEYFASLDCEECFAKCSLGVSFSIVIGSTKSLEYVKLELKGTMRASAFIHGAFELGEAKRTVMTMPLWDPILLTGMAGIDLYIVRMALNLQPYLQLEISPFDFEFYFGGIAEGEVVIGMKYESGNWKLVKEHTFNWHTVPLSMPKLPANDGYPGLDVKATVFIDFNMSLLIPVVSTVADALPTVTVTPKFSVGFNGAISEGNVAAPVGDTPQFYASDLPHNVISHCSSSSTHSWPFDCRFAYDNSAGWGACRSDNDCEFATNNECAEEGGSITLHLSGVYLLESLAFTQRDGDADRTTKIIIDATATATPADFKGNIVDFTPGQSVLQYTFKEPVRTDQIKLTAYGESVGAKCGNWGAKHIKLRGYPVRPTAREDVICAPSQALPGKTSESACKSHAESEKTVTMLDENGCRQCAKGFFLEPRFGAKIFNADSSDASGYVSKADCSCAMSSWRRAIGCPTTEDENEIVEYVGVLGGGKFPYLLRYQIYYEFGLELVVDEASIKEFLPGIFEALAKDKTMGKIPWWGELNSALNFKLIPGRTWEYGSTFIFTQDWANGCLALPRPSPDLVIYSPTEKKKAPVLRNEVFVIEWRAFSVGDNYVAEIDLVNSETEETWPVTDDPVPAHSNSFEWEVPPGTPLGKYRLAFRLSRPVTNYQAETLANGKKEVLSPEFEISALAPKLGPEYTNPDRTIHFGGAITGRRGRPSSKVQNLQKSVPEYGVVDRDKSFCSFTYRWPLTGRCRAVVTVANRSAGGAMEIAAGFRGDKVKLIQSIKDKGEQCLAAGAADCWNEVKSAILSEIQLDLHVGGKLDALFVPQGLGSNLEGHPGRLMRSWAGKQLAAGRVLQGIQIPPTPLSELLGQGNSRRLQEAPVKKFCMRNLLDAIGEDNPLKEEAAYAREALDILGAEFCLWLQMTVPGSAQDIIDLATKGGFKGMKVNFGAEAKIMQTELIDWSDHGEGSITAAMRMILDPLKTFVKEADLKNMIKKKLEVEVKKTTGSTSLEWNINFAKMIWDMYSSSQQPGRLLQSTSGLATPDAFAEDGFTLGPLQVDLPTRTEQECQQKLDQKAGEVQQQLDQCNSKAAEAAAAPAPAPCPVCQDCTTTEVNIVKEPFNPLTLVVVGLLGHLWLNNQVLVR